MGHNQFPFQILLMKVKRLRPEIPGGTALFLVLSGRVSFTVNGETFSMKAEDMLLINPYDRYTVDGDEENIVLCLSLYSGKLESYFGRPWTERFFCNTVKMEEPGRKKYDLLREKIAHLMLAELRNGPDYPVEANQYFYALLAHLLREFREKPDAALSPVPDDDRLRRVTEIIQQKFSQPLSLKELAQEEYMSYCHLSRIFRRGMGMTFTDYVGRVRIAHATEELRQTDHPITRIALNNGFVSSKAFHKAFREEYGATPNEYRKKFQKVSTALSGESPSEYRVLENDAAFRELARYMVEKDITHEEAMISETLRLELPAEAIGRLFQPKRIVNIGDVSNGLEKAVQSELSLLRQNRGFGMIRFSGLFPAAGKQSVLYNSKYNFVRQWFDFLVEDRWTPVIQLRFPEAVATVEEGKRWCDDQLETIRYLCMRYGRQTVATWYLEWQPQGDWQELNWALHEYFYKDLKSFLPEIKFGIFTLTGLNAGENRKVEDFLHLQCEKGCAPDFYSFSAVPDDTVLGAGEIGLRSYVEDVRKSLEELLGRLKESCPQAVSLSEPLIFLTDWNTLCGKTGILPGSFFRAALIMECMVGLAQSGISAMGYWLNVKVADDEDNAQSMGVLSVFSQYEQIRRPVYFCLEFMEQLGCEILASGEGYLLTRDGDRLSLLLLNANFLDPIYSVDEYWLRQQNRELTILLKRIPNGEYRVRRYKLDKDHGAIYSDLLRIGAEADDSLDTLDYHEAGLLLERTTVPKFMISKMQVEQTELSLKTILSMNACELVTFQPPY